MSTSFGHSTRFPLPAAAVRAAFTDEQYWKDRLEEVGGPDAHLIGIVNEGDRVRVDMVQAIAEEDLPPAITKIRPGNMVINRTEIWSADGGSFHASVDGAPVKINGTISVVNATDGSTGRVDGQVEVNVPLFGRKIEAGIAERLTELLATEEEFTRNWLEGRASAVSE